MTVAPGARPVTVLLIGLLVGGLAAPVATGAARGQQSQPAIDNTVTRIDVAANGSARWTIRIRTRLDTDQRVEEYTAFQARFRNNTSAYLGPFRTRMRNIVANAENATGRRMRARDLTASTSIQEVPRRWGVVTYELTWTNFAAREDEAVVVGDVFQGGFFIAANDTLQIVAPAGYEVTRIEPAPDRQDDGVVAWSGREDFADRKPTVAFAPATGQTGGGGSILDGIGGPVVVALVVVVLLGLGGAVLYRRRGPSGGPGEPAAGETGPSPTSGAATEGSSAVLTDEERVLELLEANGGRMRQAAIADEFDWSASKTSRVVGRLADDGSVEKLQLGRENIVSVPE